MKNKKVMKKVNRRVISVKRENYEAAIAALTEAGVDFTPGRKFPIQLDEFGNMILVPGRNYYLGEMVSFRIHDPVDVISDNEITKIFNAKGFGRNLNQ